MQIKHLIKSILVGFIVLSSCTAIAAPDYWIDVRTAEEFQSEHLSTAINIPHQRIAEQITTVTTDKDASIYLYCRSGRRASVALQALEALGYTRVTNIGGIDDALALEKKLQNQQADQ